MRMSELKNVVSSCACCQLGQPSAEIETHHISVELYRAYIPLTSFELFIKKICSELLINSLIHFC